MVKTMMRKFLPTAVLGPLVRARAWWKSPHVRAGSAEAVFTRIKNENLWHCDQSVSGGGSTLDFTAPLRQWLPELIPTLGVRVLLDVPCGDFSWMQHVKLEGVDYIGGDIVRELVERNQEAFGSSSRRFVHLNLAADPLPRADLLLCKDCFIHLSHELVISSLRNFYSSGIQYLLTTTYPEQVHNVDIMTGDTWPLNLERKPFLLPPPVQSLGEGTDGGMEKRIALWPRDALRKLCS